MGSVDSARASSTSRADPVGSDETGRGGLLPHADALEQSDGGGRRGAAGGFEPDADIVRGAEGREELQPLERPRQAEAGPAVRALAGDVGAAQRDGATIRAAAAR